MSGIVERWWEAKNPEVPWEGKKIVIGGSHPGGVNALLPIAELLISAYRTEVALYTAGKVNEKLVPEFTFSRHPDTIKELDTLALPESTGQAILALLSAAAPPDIDKCELPLASQLAGKLDKGENILTVLVEDAPGTLRSVLPRLADRGITGNRVNQMLLTTGGSARSYPEEEFGVPRRRMSVIGSAAFDAIKTEDTRQVNQEVRGRFGLPESLVVGYFAMPSQEPHFEGMEFRTTRTVSRAIAELAESHPDKQFAFFYRRHPREAQPEKLLSLLPQPRENLRVIPHEESQDVKTPRIAAATNLGIALGSTVLTEMALRGARKSGYSATGSMPVYLFNADLMRLLGYPDYGYEAPPPVQLGAAAVAWNEHQLLPVIEEYLLYNQSARRIIAHNQATLLKREFAFDPANSSAELAVEEIKKLLMERDR